MAKRKSINRRSSRYKRSSVGSVFLDPNTEVVSEEESFWWNNLSSSANPNLVKYNASNETSKHLDSDSQVISSNMTHAWWDELDSSDVEVSNNLPKVQSNEQSDTVSKTTKRHISDSDKEGSPPPPQKRKILIRGKSKRSQSNAFLKAFNDSKNSESSKSLQEAAVTNPINDESTINKSLEESNFTKKHMTKNDNDLTTSTSTDQSHITDKILKPKSTVFGRRYRDKGENAFKNSLESVEDKRKDTEKSSMIPTNSFDTSIERNDVSKKNISNKSKGHMPQMNSSMQNFSKLSIVDSELSKYSDKYLHKESSIREKHTNLTVNSITPLKKVSNSPINKEKTECLKTNDKNETSPKHIKYIHTLNESKISEESTHSKINNSKRKINLIEHKNVDEKNTMKKVNNENITAHTIPRNETSKSSVNLSHSKHRKTNLESNNTNTRVSFGYNNDTINNSMYDVSKSFVQISTISGHSNASYTKDDSIADTNKNKKLEIQASTPLLKKMSVHCISNLNEQNISKNNDKIQAKELDMSIPTSKQKSRKTTDIVANDNNGNVYKMDQFHHKTTDSINTDIQKKINEYFLPTISKLTSLTKANQSKNIHLKNIKEDEEINARLEKKKKTVGDIDTCLNKVREGPLLKRKEIIEKIKRLQNEGKNKKFAKTKINEAYVVNGKVYKKPKLPRPQSWVTNRFYRYLWKMMEPKYKLLTKMESEKFVKTLCNVVSSITKSKKYENYKEQLNYLINQMAHLGIVRTRNDFYDFCYEFLPYDFRVKVVPMRGPGNVRNIPYNPEMLHDPLLKE